MLSFDPKKRQTAEQLLRNPIFDNIRNKKQESGSSVKVDLSADKIQDGQNVDYRELILEAISQM
jgi:hypothetical protein